MGDQAEPTTRAAGRFVQVRPGVVSLLEEPPGAPIPGLRPGEARVEVIACGICGTDLHLWHGMALPPGVSYPVRPGHEVCGRVTELAGPAPGVAVGDLVVLHPVAPCRTCETCLRGLEHLCPSGELLGIHRPGGLADHVVWPADRMVVTNGLDPVAASVLADAVATAYRAVRTTDVPADGRLCVIGAGGVGTHVLELMRALRPDVRLAAVVGSANSADRLGAAGFEAETAGADLVRRLRRRWGSFDAVVDFSGTRAAPSQGIRLLRPGGTFLFGSVLDGDLNVGPAVAVQARELTVKGVFASSLEDLRAVVDLALSGRLDLARSVSHVASLDRAEHAFAQLDSRPPGLVRMVLTTGALGG
ncbi:alcohol dehydrogenase catalytic domain-containing protein [Acrocarpospora catenulata]|uniref:alcohol dehydrogenase catalytic domain-containing protein n=1 Tax=Acrocarpospora catenulata TaxID=2836182 RepID=UPI001BDA1547|nr:alcohol dehydrogenase catalytic domain-containing protein [Acrocarpospora catenulata]